MARVLAASLVLALAAAGCAPPARIRYEERLEEVAAPAEHAVHSERLQEIMRGLDRLSRQRLPQSFDVEAERRRRAAEVVEHALAMAESASRIAEAVPKAELEDPRRAAFEERARTLRERSLELAGEAPRLSAAEMHMRLAAIRDTCNDCHERFRERGVAPPP